MVMCSIHSFMTTLNLSLRNTFVACIGIAATDPNFQLYVSTSKALPGDDLNQFTYSICVFIFYSHVSHIICHLLHLYLIP